MFEIACSKCGVTFSPTPCAAAGVAVGDGDSGEGRADNGSYFHDGVLRCPAYMRLPWFIKKHQKSTKIVYQWA